MDHVAAPLDLARARLHARTLAVALRAGHPPPHVTQRDYEQAKLELAAEFIRAAPLFSGATANSPVASGFRA